MVTKVLLFGASTGAIRFMSNKRDLDIVAIVDNDQQKHGTLLNGIPIQSPAKILSYSFDYVIIVTQWAKEVYNQLTNDLNINPLKIVIPPKELLKRHQKPFLHHRTKELARMIIKQFSKSAEKHHVKLFADFGTLLGLIRDHDVIEWDDDIDFSVLEEERNKVSSWILQLIEDTNLPIALQTHPNYGTNGEINSYEIEFQSKETDYIRFTTSINFRQIDQNIAIHLPSAGMWYAPKEHFTQTETLIWFDTNILVPYDYKNYLSFLYGDWKTPKKEISMTDYANLADISFEKLTKSAN